MTPTISKQGFTAHPRRETQPVCFLMTELRRSRAREAVLPVFAAAFVAACISVWKLEPEWLSLTKHGRVPPPPHPRNQALTHTFTQLKQEIGVFYNVSRSVRSTVARRRLERLTRVPRIPALLL